MTDPTLLLRLGGTAVLVGLITGCATVGVHDVRQDVIGHPGAAVLIEPVPFYRQRGHECGPAALAMLAAYWGKPVTPEEIAQAIYLPRLRGTLNLDLARYTEQRGLWTRQYCGSLDDVRQKLRAGVPVLVQSRVPVPFVNAHHYWVLIGFDDVRGVLVAHSGTRAYETIPVARFERLWRRADYWTLLACPTEAARWELSAAEHNDLGLHFERTGQLARAEAEYRHAVNLAPGNAWLHFNLGNALLAQQRPAEAVACYRQAHALNPDHPDFCNNLASALADSGADLDAAAQLAQRALALVPAGQAAYLDTLGYVYLRQKNYRLARQTLDQALCATTDRQTALRAQIKKRTTALPPTLARP